MLIGTWGLLLYLSTEPVYIVCGDDDKAKACFSTFAVAA
ncbi:hypothetical protein SETIT_1G255100v2 [Setaria italica]|uniref:Uncharacterized protein n=2 Tax=Setaria TaxID=4554 RepID=A0A368PP60_SETIT|nr:hypothetical protein SETIT_1G255100v2 [Setaria italica]TKW40646.1 hypothetical protein SEVIR_1G259300v2 [Setaria viridis]